MTGRLNRSVAIERPPFLGPGEPAAVEVINGDSPVTIFLTCDHASNRLPERLGNLGLAQQDIDSHIGWDIGAAAVARGLARTLNAPLVVTAYSRLVIDCNRPPASPESIPSSSAGITVPGNSGLSDDMRQLRRATFFAPYHNAIASLLDHRARASQPTALLAIHSFTPNYPGQERPWHVDFAYNRDRQLAGLLIDAMAHQSDLMIGDNLPYGVDDESDFTIPVHGERRGLPSVLIEVRQDLLATPAGFESWISRLTELLTGSRQLIERLALSASRQKD